MFFYRPLWLRSSWRRGQRGSCCVFQFRNPGGSGRYRPHLLDARFALYKPLSDRKGADFNPKIFGGYVWILPTDSKGRGPHYPAGRSPLTRTE